MFDEINQTKSNLNNNFSSTMSKRTTQMRSKTYSHMHYFKIRTEPGLSRRRVDLSASHLQCLAPVLRMDLQHFNLNRGCTTFCVFCSSGQTVLSETHHFRTSSYVTVTSLSQFLHLHQRFVRLTQHLGIRKNLEITSCCFLF